MKTHLFLKLGIAIVLIFGLLLAGFALYEPAWYRYYEWRLCSDDAEVRDAAAAVVADKGERAIPYIRKWLKYSDDKHVIGACLIVDKMDGDIWKQVLPELGRVLYDLPSERTYAVAAVMEKHKFNWENHYKEDPVRTRNLLCYRLLKSSNAEKRYRAAYALELICDPHAIAPLINAIQNDNDSEVRSIAAKSLSVIDNKRALEVLLSAIIVEKDPDVRGMMVCILGNTKDLRVVELLIDRLKNDISDVRHISALSLGEIGGDLVVDQLINILQNESDSYVRDGAATALCKISDEKAVAPLLDALYNDNDSDVRASIALSLSLMAGERAKKPLMQVILNDNNSSVRGCAAVGLSYFNGNEIKRTLKKAMENGNKVAHAAMAFKYGGEHLKGLLEDYLFELEFKASRNNEFKVAQFAHIRWGDCCSSRGVLQLQSLVGGDPYEESFPYYENIYNYLFAKALSGMPEGFPKFDYQANLTVQEKQFAAIRSWLEKNKHRLAWDAEKRKYFLNPEAEKK